MAWTEWAKIFFGQFEQSHCRPQTAAVFRMGGVFEILLQMDKRPCRLDQSLEKIVVLGVGIQPEMLQNIMRFVVALLIPAAKVGAIKRMLCDFAGKLRVLTFEVANELRNSFAFVHEGFNFSMPQMMGKPTFPEGPDDFRRRSQE